VCTQTRATCRDHARSSARFISQLPAPLPINFDVTPKNASSHWPASRKSNSSKPSSRPSCTSAYTSTSGA
jgi:hypothetical protein